MPTDPTTSGWTRAWTAVGVAAVICGLTVVVRATSGANDAAAVPDRAASAPYLAKYLRPGQVPFPSDNAYTPARDELGRMLFFDPRLSGSGWISCASCHNPAFSWGDGLPRAIGHGMKTLGRRTPTLLNLAWGSSMFWDGRAETLEEQALGPIEAPGEMNLSLREMVEKIAAIDGYRQAFATAYPGEPIAAATVARAIATFERGIVSRPAPFDRWVAGEEQAIPADAKRGFLLFNTKARCAQCHTGWRFTDDSFHDIGVVGSDEGRGKVLAGIESMQHAFKTPTLRDVDRRAPYMHDGSVATLDAVIDLYDRGGDIRRGSLSPEMKPLGLTRDERAQLLAFLRTLTAPADPAVVPALPR